MWVADKEVKRQDYNSLKSLPAVIIPPFNGITFFYIIGVVTIWSKEKYILRTNTRHKLFLNLFLEDVDSEIKQASEMFGFRLREHGLMQIRPPKVYVWERQFHEQEYRKKTKEREWLSVLFKSYSSTLFVVYHGPDD